MSDNRKDRKKERILDLADKLNESPWPLMERERGEILYEHRYSECFYRDICIGAAERDYYFDRYHELQVCVYYNRRIPGKYEFVPEWQFIAAKSRICLSIYWNLGIIPDEDDVIEKYISLDDARESVFYDDFVDLKNMAEDSMAWTRDHKGSPFDRSDRMFSFRPDPCGDLKYDVFEITDRKRKEFVQFYWREADDTWDMMSVSREPLSDLMRYFKDFDELDRNELHLRRFLSEKEYAEEGSEYYKEYRKAVSDHESMQRAWYF